MKLLTRATSYFFAGYAVVIMAGGIFLYFTIKTLVYKQIDGGLVSEKNIIQEQIDLTDTIPELAPTMRRQIEVRLFDKTVRYSEIFRDTSLYDTTSDNYGSFRYLRYTSSTPDGTGYSITIIRPLDEKDELLKDIGLYMFYLFLTILLATILINYLVSRRLWRPFYKTVKETSNFNVQTDNPLELPESETEEFNRLNSVINQMTERMKRDYINLKEFNEDASHEIQTPLAIIRSKLELLMQNSNLRKEDIESIRTINEATDRLLRVNQGLLLISKIENNYFQNPVRISLKEKVIGYLNDYSEIVNIKEIRTEVTGDDPAEVVMDEILAGVLVSNLISNAVRYNIDGGFISCRTDTGSLTVSNSGPPLTTEPGLLFKRFRRGGQGQNSVGLGLSIVKKITDTYCMSIDYTFSEGVHTIKLGLPLTIAG
ncbi:MAG TPA: HAMP domain-containing sensor histidine kinase [Bacteroidales bacterium]|nr:HAMP domain-containing sensor histidine kinase [Bacteroidales bacterium]